MCSGIRQQWHQSNMNLGKAIMHNSQNKSSQRLPNTPVCQHQWMPCSISQLCLRLRTWRMSQGSHSGETWTQYVVQPTQCINQLWSWYLKTFRKNVQKTLQGQRPDCNETQTSCVVPPAGCKYQVSNLYLETCRKKSGNFSLVWRSINSPFRVFLSTRGPKIAQAWRNIPVQYHKGKPSFKANTC